MDNEIARGVLMNRSVSSLNNTFLIEPNEIAKTLEIGLYHRFKKDLADTQKENPYDFEHFIAEVFKRYYGGHIKVTKASGDMGVDIIHYRPKGLILGQVKCYAPQNNVGYETIAILHSQIIQGNAHGGFVATTSNFTSSAINYARKLSIDLYDGSMLVDMLLNNRLRPQTNNWIDLLVCYLRAYLKSNFSDRKIVKEKLLSGLSYSSLFSFNKNRK